MMVHSVALTGSAVPTAPFTSVHLCSFTLGCFTVRSSTGRQGLDFEDSERFGPAKVNMRSGDLTEIGERHWFWSFYGPWREAGRPTTGEVRNTPNGPLEVAVWGAVSPASQPGMEGEARNEPNPTPTESKS